ncbi:MAG: TIGR01777 family oxidoreductase [Verrucomicrobiales bacterium]
MNTTTDLGTPKLVIAGGSGYLGRRLVRAALGRGSEVVVLSRRGGGEISGARVVEWDGRTRGEWVRELEGAAGLVNLAGESVNCRYTRRALAAMDGSRVDSTRVLGDAIHGCVVPPRVWVQASSLAIHGDGGDRWCDEEAGPGTGPGVVTARKWERAFAESPTPRTRRVVLRISFVLGRGGGALSMLERATRAFLGGAVGSGRQYVSWIHESDMNRILLRAVEDSGMSGIYVASSPDPVRNEEFMRELRGMLGRPWAPRTPAWLVRVGCWLMRTEPMLALTGRRGDPRRLEEAGFTFRFPTLREALVDLYESEGLAAPARTAVSDGPVGMRKLALKWR